MVENRDGEIEALGKRIAEIGDYLHIDRKKEELEQLTARSTESGFWDDAETASKTMARAGMLKRDIDEFVDVGKKLEDIEIANQLAVEDDDDSLSAEVEEGLAKLVDAVDNLELDSWFDGEFDDGDAIVTVTPGQGGLEAQDWTDMLFHMYLNYCQRRGWKVTINDAPVGEAIGIDRAVFTVSGRNAYGMLTSEVGVHRLVRISPTDAKKRRQTTFAGVEVLPVIPDDIAIDIDPGDLRIDVYHATGHGGQGVNTTDSAVRITHLPTGIVVTCQNERSQLQNKATAMGILRSKLYELEEERRANAIDELRGPKHEISFGNQIRNYVLYPYQMVKDLRTDVETGNVDGVFAGDLDQFIIPYHRWRVANAQ